MLPVLPVLFFTGGTKRADGVRTRPPKDVAPGRNAPPAKAAPPGGGARPYLIVAGLTLSFSIFTLLGTLIISALPLPDDTIRWAGLVLLVLLGVAMIFPRFEQVLERPFARLGQRRVSGEHGGFVLGLALGAVYVPCAGPVLAAITVAGATHHIGGRTVALTLAFAVGTALPLLVFALAGRAVADRVRAFRDRQRAYRAVAGVVVIALAVALTFNVTDALQRDVPDYTASANHKLQHKVTKALNLGPPEALEGCAEEPASALQNCGKMPALQGISTWINTANGKPVTAAQLRGKVVLVDFWAYSCINCQRAIPHVEAWYQRYAKDGLVVVGVHTPEYAFEHEAGNVAAGAKRLHISYPVAIDNGYRTWNAFHNDSWPAEYLIDSNGYIRHVAIGEGDYVQTEGLIRQLIKAAKPGVRLPLGTSVQDTTPTNQNQTPETYLGSERTQTAVNGNGGKLANGTRTYSLPAQVPTSRYGLGGTWTESAQHLTAGAGATIRLGYNASDVYLDVGGRGTITSTVNGKTSTQSVSGAPDIYTVAHSSAPHSAVVTIRLSPGLQAYSFTFG